MPHRLTLLYGTERTAPDISARVSQVQFDFLSFYILLAVLKADETLFQTGWFVESLSTQVLVIFIIRTRGNPLKSRAHPALVATSLSVMAVAAILPFTPLGAYFGPTPALCPAMPSPRGPRSIARPTGTVAPTPIPEKHPMSLKYLTLSSVAALTVALSGAVFAETASDKATAAAQAQEEADMATDTAKGQPAGTAMRNKQTKVDEATAADTKAHAYPTEANRQARDKAESDAAAAAGMPHPADRTGDR